MSTWRQKAQSVIAEVESTFPKGGDFGALKRALFDAYPFAQRQYYPYKVWCEEQRLAFARFRGDSAPPLLKRGRKPKVVDPNQMEIGG